MRRLGARLGTNLLWLVVFTVLVVIGAFLTFVSGIVFSDKYPVSVTMPEAGGILPGMEVTVLGRSVGLVDDVTVVQEGVVLDLSIDESQQVPRDATVQVIRRSPIGEQAVDFQPQDTPWEPAEAGARIVPAQAIVPAKVPFLLEEAKDLFAAIDVDDTATVVHEFAQALDGRGERLRQLNQDSLDLNRTLVDAIPDFERLLDSSERILATLSDHREDLADFITNSADLSEVLADERPRFERLLDVATPALDRADALIRNSRANLSCAISDLTDVNRMLNGPSTAVPTMDHQYASKLDELEQGLARNRWFFRWGFDLLTPFDPQTGANWAQIMLDVDGEQGGQPYPEKRPTPATRPGAACETAAFGTGVNAVGAPGRPQDRTRPDSYQAPDPTSPGIEWAPVVATRGGQPVTPPADQDRPPLPATGGGAGLVLVALPLLGAGVAWRRRRP